MSDEIQKVAREFALSAAKLSVVRYQNELLTIINEALKQGYTDEQIIKALVQELGKDAG